ncbi:MAG: UDP-N-acetylglucosamine 1-carboxyvinyltransferase [Candidatus Omnitrophota bacterium]|nr:UDP-N-acetylglucosamine 1-carboxyvinyltransferase [Candidatus Omnitrophota bacterium]MBU1928873.1 UDP-N-acetylglucosamine 1-carboxyvinyltransferase [Candidatus Omnitrophota bacterium]MBU2034483.1 UDP-N-acetylglucosamine 1-carboxyvinyltransferase [Candidatus Omnitrophota bacterium]MBU2221497.1 UDP-N-acetylglucosamine 1-carboxyvinyltransferase [Candidatus Omnitrophota bacterium]MBU2258630.1 UDP-N-acetylglucosamine 1-carboxyvinyltransferase [Candidatus Omnitrophota bacterium]
MDRLVIEGGVRLKGEVLVSGSKNSVLPILAATLMTDEPCVIRGVPNLRDVITMLKILRSLGKMADYVKGVVKVTQAGDPVLTADYKLVSTMRASFCVLGPLLGRFKKARVSLPGGCIIGVRPVDLHLKGLRALGAHIDIESGYVVAKASRLKGSYMYLGGVYGSSVLATDNVMMAAVFAKGKTVIESAACEPEIADLAEFLIKMGAKIKGHGTPIIEIEGVKKLHGCEHKIIPDRIEAGTLMAAALITKGDLNIKNALYPHLGAVIDKLEESGASIIKSSDSIRVRLRNKLKPINVTTLPYPGFPTDMQAQVMSLMTITSGISVITEKIYPDRFMHVAELNRMGALIQREGPHAIVEGVKGLSGAQVMASDLRASACLVLAGLAAKGITSISRIYHLERGYENLEDKLRGAGARIWREKE